MENAHPAVQIVAILTGGGVLGLWIWCMHRYLR